MRGTPSHVLVYDHLIGIIPAYAGNTQCQVGILQSRGGGSSPRMRGTPQRGQHGSKSHTIIPAYAGNTAFGLVEFRPNRDHPRVCGEHFGAVGGDVAAEGSSPRMRGTRHRRSVRSLRAGIIPAYAGNTCAFLMAITSFGDHPRVCGEHCCPLPANLTLPGSSPRMRGTPKRMASESRHGGIIPAYAGNTIHPAVCSDTSRDHPRVCGEHISSTCNSTTVRGSSPRMRGTRSPSRRTGRLPGIIPAYAGNTKCSSRTAPTSRDHPRVCGEHQDSSNAFARAMGSSPRMRGTRF